MHPADLDRFTSLIADVLSFYGQAPSQFALSVWWEACREFEYDAVQRALGRHAMDPERGQFAPKPADLVRQMRGTPTDRAAKAWSVVIASASRVGAYTDVVFDDPIIHAVIEDLGGWPAVCRTETEALSYTQHRFTEAYRAYSNRGDLREWPQKLTGDRSPDDVFLARGKAPPEPMLIGDRERAKRVLRGGSVGSRHQLTKFADSAEGAVAAIAHDSSEDAA